MELETEREKELAMQQAYDKSELEAAKKLKVEHEAAAKKLKEDHDKAAMLLKKELSRRDRRREDNIPNPWEQIDVIALFTFFYLIQGVLLQIPGVLGTYMAHEVHECADKYYVQTYLDNVFWPSSAFEFSSSANSFCAASMRFIKIKM